LICLSMMPVLIFHSFDPLLSSQIFLFFQSTHLHAHLLLMKNSVNTWLSNFHLIPFSVLFILKIFTSYFTQLNSPLRLLGLWFGWRWRRWRWLPPFFGFWLYFSFLVLFFSLFPLFLSFPFSLFSLNLLLFDHYF